MPKYLIERTVPGVARMSPEQLHRLAAQSNAVLHSMGPAIQWVHSYVADERLFCVYNCEDEQLIREHARRGGFPCDDVRQVTGIIDPVTGED